MEDYGKFKMYKFGKRNGFVQCRHGKYLRYRMYRSYFLQVSNHEDSCF